jgi:hypothetical protein
VEELLHQRWIHSHEEDSANEMVFRPASFHFPPSRGRIGFELKPDRSYTDIGIAPGDGPAESTGSWKVDRGELQLFSGSSSTPTQTYRIIASSKDRLVVGR